MLILRPRQMLIPTTMEVTMVVDMDMELATGGIMVDMVLATADTMDTMADKSKVTILHYLSMHP